MTFWTQEEAKKVRKNYVPHKRSSYAPEGCFRCEKCGSIVKDGAVCTCVERNKRNMAQDQRVREASDVFVPTRNLVGKKVKK